MVRTKWLVLNEFSLYFFKEWCYHNNEWSRWWRWQIFQTPAGVAKTNNPMESFNKQIKSVYTNYELYTVHQFLLIVMQKLINQFSYQPKEFCFFRAPHFDVIKKANEICNDDSCFIQNSSNTFWYKSRYILQVEDSLKYAGFKLISCSCIDFYTNLNCKHTIALAIFRDFKFKGFELKKKLSANNTGRI